MTMGCRTNFSDLDTSGGRLYLTRVRLDRGGYERDGTYWGVGTPLWAVRDWDRGIHYLRANDREAAKRVVRANCPNATFYR